MQLRSFRFMENYRTDKPNLIPSNSKITKYISCLQKYLAPIAFSFLYFQTIHTKSTLNKLLLLHNLSMTFLPNYRNNKRTTKSAKSRELILIYCQLRKPQNLNIILFIYETKFMF